MGRRDRMSNPVVHRTKLFGGRRTAAEVHAQHGFRRRCEKCGGPPSIQIKMFMLHDEFVKRAPLLAAEIAASNASGPYVPAVETKFGNMVMYAKVTACRMHAKELEHMAAKAPSYVMVEIDRGPGPENPIVQVSNVPLR